jgi:hypothetical protein
MLPVALIFTIIFARISTTYDSRNSRGKYITIKSDALAGSSSAEILTPSSFFAKQITENRHAKANKNTFFILLFI